MSKDNFKCNECKFTFYERTYRKYSGKKHYTRPNGIAIISCPKCDTIDINTIKEGVLNSNGIGTYSIMSKEQKVASLKSRSKKHFTKKIKTKKAHINHEFKKNLSNG